MCADVLGVEGAGIFECFCCFDADVFGGDETAACGEPQTVCIFHIENGIDGAFFFAADIDLALLEPDHVGGQRLDLLFGKSNAGGDVHLLGIRNTRIHECLECGFIVGIAVEVTFAGLTEDLLSEKLLLVEAVADSLGDFVRIPAKALVHVVGGEEFPPVGEGGIGLDEIFGRALGVHAVEGADEEMLGALGAAPFGKTVRCKTEGGEGVMDAPSLLVGEILAGDAALIETNTDGGGLAAGNFGRHEDRGLVAALTSFARPGRSPRVAELRGSKCDGLCLLFLCLLCEGTGCVERSPRDDVAVFVYGIAVQLDAAARTDVAGHG